MVKLLGRILARIWTKLYAGICTRLWTLLWGNKSGSSDAFYITLLKYARGRMDIAEGTVEYADLLLHVQSIHGEISEQVIQRTYLQAVVTVPYIGREPRPE